MSIAVLIADDHAVVRDGLRLLLECQSDMRVVGTVADGRAAVEAVLRLQPDVVIMDLAMPLLNGADATAQILDKRPDSRPRPRSRQETGRPGYKDVAAKYKGDKAAPANLAAKIKNGGKGAWGAIPMPPNNVSEAEAKRLADWVLSL